MPKRMDGKLGKLLSCGSALVCPCGSRDTLLLMTQRLFRDPHLPLGKAVNRGFPPRRSHDLSCLAGCDRAIHNCRKSILHTEL